MYRIVICATLILAAFVAATPRLQAANDRPLLFGMNPTPMEWWGYDPAVWEPLLHQKMAEAGCTSCRVGVNWNDIEPTQGVRDWSDIDYSIKLLLDNNIEPVILINSTPQWALPDYVDPSVPAAEARYPPSEQHVETFKSWVYDLVRRYRGQCRYYEMWNEANGYGWYTALLNPPSYGRADLYTPWMIRAYDGVKLADSTAMMSTTGIDDGGDGHAADFLEGIYNYGGKGYFDAVADHPYAAGGPFQSFKMDEIRATLDAHGDTDVDVWITEFGYAMNPGQYPLYQQYLQNYFDVLTQNQYDYVTIATWHTANEFPWESGYGLMNQDLTPKPPYTTFKNYPKPARPKFLTIGGAILGPTSIRVTWTTDIPSRGLVMYGKDTTYGQITPPEPAPVTSHEVVLTGLTPATTYNFRIRCGAHEDGDSFSPNRVARTANGTAVQITSGPSVVHVGATSALISWQTDVPSSSTVHFSQDFGYNLEAASAGATTDHQIQLSGLNEETVYQFRVASSADGYATGYKEGNGFRTKSRLGQLDNGSFEDGSAGWTFWEIYPWGAGAPDYPGHVSIYTNNGGAFPPTPASKDGAKRLTVDRGYASAVGGIYQTVETEPGLYLVGGWVAAGTDDSHELIEFIAGDGQYTGGIPSGTRVAQLTSSTGWQYYSTLVPVNSGYLTIATRVSQETAAGAVAGHFDGITVARVEQAPIGTLKSLDVGSTVSPVAPVVVSAVLAPDVFYAQAADRSSGIKVQTASPHGVAVGDTVGFYGTLIVMEGEAVVIEAEVTSSAPSSLPEPLSLRPDRIGGVPNGVQPGTTGGSGVNNTGLLISTWGAYTYIDPNNFTIQGPNGETVKCHIPAGVTLSSGWSFVRATGVSSCEIDGGSVVPVLLVRQQSDIQGF